MLVVGSGYDEQKTYSIFKVIYWCRTPMNVCVAIVIQCRSLGLFDFNQVNFFTKIFRLFKIILI